MSKSKAKKQQPQPKPSTAQPKPSVPQVLQKACLFMILEPTGSLIPRSYPSEEIFNAHKLRQKEYFIMISKTIKALLEPKELPEYVHFDFRVKPQWVDNLLDVVPTFVVSDTRVVANSKLLRFGQNTIVGMQDPSIAAKNNADILKEYHMLCWMMHHYNCFPPRDFVVHIEALRYFLMYMIGVDFFQHLKRYINDSKLTNVQSLQPHINECNVEQCITIHHESGSLKFPTVEELEQTQQDIRVFGNWKELKQATN
jgi:hypothetical protein